MSETVVAKRYAKALFEVALERNLLDQVEKDLQFVVETFSSTPELTEWLNHPTTDSAKKKEFFSSVFTQVTEAVKNLLFLLADRHRENIIAEISAHYKHLSNESKGIADAIVTTAFPMTDEDKKELVETFQPIVGKTLQIKEVVDSDILGGAIVQVGDRLYDGSLRTKLIRFQERLKGTRIG